VCGLHVLTCGQEWPCVVRVWVVCVRAALPAPAWFHVCSVTPCFLTKKTAQNENRPGPLWAEGRAHCSQPDLSQLAPPTCIAVWVRQLPGCLSPLFVTTRPCGVPALCRCLPQGCSTACASSIELCALHTWSPAVQYPEGRRGLATAVACLPARAGSVFRAALE
jgi:hypothetical protein